ncbi:hypothetical protein N9R79_06520 [Vibrio sp.]|nr:hypothetical protein [Vibrio sp.]
MTQCELKGKEDPLLSLNTQDFDLDDELSNSLISVKEEPVEAIDPNSGSLESPNPLEDVTSTHVVVDNDHPASINEISDKKPIEHRTERTINESYISKEMAGYSDFKSEYTVIKSALKTNSTGKEDMESLRDVLAQLQDVSASFDLLETSISRLEEARKKAQECESLIGLFDRSLPYGSYKPVKATNILIIDASVEPTVKLFSDNLNNLGEALLRGKGTNDLDRLSQLIHEQMAVLRQHDLTSSEFVWNRVQQRAWRELHPEENRKAAGHHIDIMIHKLNLFMNEHKKVLEAHQAWLAKGGDPEDEPYLGDMIKHLDTVLKGLSHKIDELSIHSTPQQKEQIKAFEYALDKYYEDQIRYGLSGGRGFNPIKPSLGQLQESIDQSRFMQTAFDEALQLELSMEKVYLLHWIGDEALTLAWRRSEKGKKKRHMDVPGILYNFHDPILNASFHAARGVRNQMAHAGLLYDPEQMQVTCDNYIKGIQHLIDAYSVDLSRLKIQTKSRPVTKEEYSDVMWKVSKGDRGFDLNYLLDIYTGFDKEFPFYKECKHQRDLEVAFRKEYDRFCRLRFTREIFGNPTERYEQVNKIIEKLASTPRFDKEKARKTVIWTLFNFSKSKLDQQETLQNMQTIKEAYRGL